MFDEETEHEIDTLAEEFMEAVRDERLMFYEGCTIVTAPTGAPPEYITVMVDGINDPNVEWRGVPGAPTIGQEVLVWHNPISDRREILAASGAAGATTPFIHDHHDNTEGGDALNPETISPQTFVVGPAPCPHDTVGEAVIAVNAAGPPTAANPYVIEIQGIVTAEAGNVAIPNYCHVIGKGPGSTIGMGANTLSLYNYASLTHLTVLSTAGAGNAAVDVETKYGSQVIRDCHIENSGAGYGVWANELGGTNKAYIYDSTIIGGSDGVLVSGSATYPTTLYMNNCRVTGDTDGLHIDDAECVVYSEYCTFSGATNDVNVAAGTWSHHKCEYDINNSTIAGTETPMRDGAIEIPSDAIRSHNSLFPDIGTTTLAQKMGDVYLGTAKDIYPGDDEAGLWQRRNNWRTIQTHFDGAAMPAGWAWAGAPFVTPATIGFATDSLMNMGFGAAQGLARGFLYRTDDEDQGAKRVLFAPQSFIDLTYFGVRMDDGTDNNYVESVLRKTAAADTYELVSRHRIGAGAPVVAVQKTWSALPMFYEVSVGLWGALWGAWGYNTELGINAPAVDAYGIIGALAWTCTRQGVTFYTSQAVPDTWRGPYVDWYAY